MKPKTAYDIALKGGCFKAQGAEAPASAPDRSAAIPTFAADGRRLRNYHETSILRLLTLDLVVVERNRKGKIRCAHFRPQGGANPIHKHAHMGQHYSFNERIGEVHVWQHRRLIAGPLTPEERANSDLFIRAIFRAVPLSCMQQPSALMPQSGMPLRGLSVQPLAKVVSIAACGDRSAAIDSCRRKRKGDTYRPVEFDSQGRLAA